jgi:hypothetical protein
VAVWYLINVTGRLIILNIGIADPPTATLQILIQLGRAMLKQRSLAKLNAKISEKIPMGPAVPMQKSAAALC